MGRKAKYSQEKKLEIVRAYLECQGSSLDLGRRYGCNDRTVRSWAERYRFQGEEAFRESSWNQALAA